MSDFDTNERTEKAFDTRNTVRDAQPGVEASDDDSLLELDKPEAAKKMLKDWDHSWKTVSKYIEQWKVNRARSQGFIGVQLIKKQDRQQAYIPTGAKKGVAGMNKAARLSRRLRASIFADAPVAEATPSTDSDEDRDAAETSTRILADICAEGNLAYTLHCGDAFDLGGDYGSGFIRFWVDETGGGWRPKQIQASPQAVDAKDPFPIDPMTGEPRPCDPISRFVTQGGQFTAKRSEAEKVWLPKLRDEVLTGKQVRFLPADVRDIWECDGVMIGQAVTLGELKRLFPEIKEWQDERIATIVTTRPSHWRDILEPHQKDTGSESVTNASLVFVLTRYHVQSPLYPTGAYLIACGSDEMLHRSEWYDGEHGTPLDIPLTQLKQLTDEGNPYGDGVMSSLGPGNEVRGSLLGAMLEHLRRFQNRHIFVPMTSPLQAQQLQAPAGTPISILPGGEPKYEELPDFPIVVEKMEKLISADMDDESGLQQVGQAISPPGVKSALHANVILQQVQVGLSDLRQNTERALVRGWRIMLQLIRAYYSVPQQVSWVGDDGRYKQQSWTGADLGSTKDVRIQRGSFTMMSPTAKAELAHNYAQAGLISPQELQHVIESNVGGLFGLQDNPDRLRVKRQIAAWNDGPAGDGSVVQAPPMPPPIPGQPPAPNPFGQKLAAIFEPVPSDTEPQVAALRMFELRRALASTKAQKWPPAWRQGLDMAYGQARQAAQLPDAKMLEGLQQELQKTKDQLMDAKIKLNAASVSFSGKLADLDENQTLAIMQKEGIQLPPRSRPIDDGKKNEIDPIVQLEHERQMHEDTLALDAHKHRMDTAAAVEKEKIKAHGKLMAEERKLAHAAHESRKQTKEKGKEKQKAPVVKVNPTINVNLPPNKGSKVVRGKDGKIEGTKPND